MLLNAISIDYPFAVVYRNPFKWHYKFPFIFFWPTVGRGNKSRKIGRFPRFKFSFYCYTMSYLAFFSLAYSFTFFCKAFTCFYIYINLDPWVLLKTISFTKTEGSANFGKVMFEIEFGKWKLNLSEENFP